MSRLIHPRHPEREGGYVLLSVAFMVLIVGGVSYSFLMNGLAERASLENHENTMLSLEIAEMGIVRSEMELRGQIDHDADGLGNVTGEYSGGTYSTVTTPYPGEPDRFTVTATGTYRMATRRIEVGMRLIRASRFSMALFGKDDVKLSGGASSDAYDSRLGTYASQAKKVDGFGNFAQAKGDVGSNGSLDVNATVTVVRGDATPGVGESVSGNGHVTGSKDARPEPAVIAPVPYEEFVATMLDNDNDLLLGESWYDPASMSVNIKGKAKVNIPAGTYFFTDFSLGNLSEVTITGKTTIYATGDLSLTAHSLFNSTGKPEDFQVLHQNYPLPPGHVPGTKAISVTAHSVLVMAAFAPDREIKVTAHGEFFGAFIGKSVMFAGGGGMHYDLALGDAGGSQVIGLQRIYWRDLAPPRR